MRLDRTERGGGPGRHRRAAGSAVTGGEHGQRVVGIEAAGHGDEAARRREPRRQILPRVVQRDGVEIAIPPRGGRGIAVTGVHGGADTLDRGQQRILRQAPRPLGASAVQGAPQRGRRERGSL